MRHDRGTRELANARRVPGVIDVGVRDDNQLDVLERPPLASQGTCDVLFLSGEAGVHEDATIVADDEVRVDHLEG